jgi:hypothetical protein
MWIPSGQNGERETEFHKCNHYNWLRRSILISPAVIWHYKSQSERSAMRIASSPTLRIAAGLLLAALLNIVGYQVFRRWISHGPEALLKRADDLSWPANWATAAGSACHSQARAHRTKPDLIGSVPNNGPKTAHPSKSRTGPRTGISIPRLTACSTHDLSCAPLH